jgi:hypothetical protein
MPPAMETRAPAPAVVPSSEEPGAVPLPPARRPVVKPLSDEHYRLQITIGRDTSDKLREAQALMRHRIPNGDPAAIVDRALDALLRELVKSKAGAAERPRASPSAKSGPRHIPAAVKRAVWTRDRGACAFQGAGGRRCLESGFLECHHVVPYAKGGAATADNIELRCRAHNAYEAEKDFGMFVREDRPGFDARPARG